MTGLWGGDGKVDAAAGVIAGEVEMNFAESSGDGKDGCFVDLNYCQWNDQMS